MAGALSVGHLLGRGRYWAWYLGMVWWENLEEGPPDSAPRQGTAVACRVREGALGAEAGGRSALRLPVTLGQPLPRPALL